MTIMKFRRIMKFVNSKRMYCITLSCYQEGLTNWSTMGCLFSSSSDLGNVTVNVSVTENDPREIVVTYSGLSDVRESDITWTWESEGGGRVGVLYVGGYCKHRFRRPIPEDVFNVLGNVSTYKCGGRYMVTIKTYRDTSIRNYVTGQGM